MPSSQLLETRPRSEADVLTIEHRPRSYLEMFNLFRVIACLAVLGQHSFIWANMSSNVVGTGFITMLHLSRTCFFFLTGLVVCYAQITHPRSLLGFWKRRYWEVGIPYLAWTGIYLIFTLITVDFSWDEAGAFLRHNIPLGFSQMYYVIVIFQFYFLFPLLLKLLRATRHHGRVMAVSLGLAIGLAIFQYYPTLFSPGNHITHAINTSLPVSRDFLSYQEFFIAGMLVALNLDRVLEFVSTRYRQILVASAAVGVAEVLWYMISVWSGDSLARASDIYQPSAVVWCLAAIAGLLAISWRWNQRTRKYSSHGSPRRSFPSTAYWAGLTGGVFFAHTLFIDPIRSTLDMTGLRTTLPWEATVTILFVGVVACTWTFIALILHTPLRWVLGGPLRSQQRASYDTLGPGTVEKPLRPNGRSRGQRVAPRETVSAGGFRSKGENT
jgi:peptidoglycan/LPS O-acetylase OafA/YrhL